jgi:hypothetical protein
LKEEVWKEEIRTWQLWDAIPGSERASRQSESKKSPKREHDRKGAKERDTQKPDLSLFGNTQIESAERTKKQERLLQ